MTERPILRLPDPRAAPRKTGTPDRSPKPRGPNSGQQGHRLSHKMQRISDALETDDPAIQLRQDPAGYTAQRLRDAVDATNFSEAEDFFLDVRRRWVLAQGSTSLRSILENRVRAWNERKPLVEDANGHDRTPDSQTA